MKLYEFKLIVINIKFIMYIIDMNYKIKLIELKKY